jgi:serine/threonine protein kinase
VQLLGRGGFGEVWKASRPGDVYVALKIIDLTGQAFGQFDSLRWIKSIRQSYLVSINGFWLKDERGEVIDDTQWRERFQPVELLIEMLLADKSLHDRLRECEAEGLPGIPIDELMEYMDGAARGIDFLNRPVHDLGQGPVSIVHGDIKPLNIMIVGGEAAISDFWLAQAVHSRDKGTHGPLTFAYAAPEAFQGKHSDRSDQYSLAISYVELRTGSLPFKKDSSLAEVMQAHMKGTLDLSGVPLAEREVIQRATNPASEGRWSSSREMVKALKRAVGTDHLSGYLDTAIVGTATRGTMRLPQAPAARSEASTDLPTPSAQQYENVQFTVYRPKTLRPDEWQLLLAFGHLDERLYPADPDPIQEVKRQASQALGERVREYEPTRQDSLAKIPHAGALTFIPEMEGAEFNPQQQTVRFIETVHKVEFRMRTDSSREAQTLRGRLSVFLGALLVADVPLRIKVDSASDPTDAWESQRMRRYRKIFASYSHHDWFVVEQFERLAHALGDHYLRDCSELRAGERWDDRLLRMIEEADIFQLFWSSNSMRSINCRREWEHALALKRENFIRPTYWEEPLPQSPEEGLPPSRLLALHFTRFQWEDWKDYTTAAAATPRETSLRASPDSVAMEPLCVESRHRASSWKLWLILIALLAIVVGIGIALLR